MVNDMSEYEKALNRIIRHAASAECEELHHRADQYHESHEDCPVRAQIKKDIETLRTKSPLDHIIKAG